MRTLLEIVIIVVASSNLLMARFVLFRIKQPTTLFRWLIKVFTSAVAPFLFLLGLTAAVLGYVLDSMPAIIIGECSALLFLVHIVLVTRAPGKSADFKIAFGFDWAKSILFERKTHFLSRRYVIRLPKSAAPIFNQNICFYTIPETNRPLLCDIWQPPKNVKPSGVAFIYL
ncbi:MAG TPA: hypothetical protein VFP87_10850, partial [Chitinophagaceae bacterium]|nr:hypothetical protein [Chitinophagaceae bacterium]